MAGTGPSRWKDLHTRTLDSKAVAGGMTGPVSSWQLSQPCIHVRTQAVPVSKPESEGSQLASPHGASTRCGNDIVGFQLELSLCHSGGRQRRLP